MTPKQIATKALKLHAKHKSAEAAKLLHKHFDVKNPNIHIVEAMAQMMTSINDHHQAYSLWGLCIKIDPTRAFYHVNFAACMNEIGMKAEAKAVAENLVKLAPNYSDAHNILGCITGEQKHYRRALAIDPSNFHALNNLSFFVEGKERRDLLLRAIKLAPDHASINVWLALSYFEENDFETGWPYYEKRLSEQKHTADYETNATRWQGEPLDGKSITVFAEQGVGDEVMFLTALGGLRNAARVIVACDHRLVGLVASAYPWVSVVPCLERIDQGRRVRGINEKTDYWLPMADLWRYFDERENSLYTDKRVDVPSGSIGIAWRSGGNNRGEWPGAGWAEKLVRKNPDKTFVNMQYKITDDDRERLGAYGNFMEVDGDLFNDIELNCAIALSCERVIGLASAPTMFARSCGARVAFICGGLPWWSHKWDVEWCLPDDLRL